MPTKKPTFKQLVNESADQLRITKALNNTHADRFEWTLVFSDGAVAFCGEKYSAVWRGGKRIGRLEWDAEVQQYSDLVDSYFEHGHSNPSPKPFGAGDVKDWLRGMGPLGSFFSLRKGDVTMPKEGHFTIDDENDELTDWDGSME